MAVSLQWIVLERCWIYWGATEMSLRIALPKGRLLADTAALLKRAGWDIDGYDVKMRCYRLKSEKYSDIGIKVFQENFVPGIRVYHRHQLPTQDADKEKMVHLHHIAKL